MCDVASYHRFFWHAPQAKETKTYNSIHNVCFYIELYKLANAILDFYFEFHADQLMNSK